MDVELLFKDKGTAGYNRSDDAIYDINADGSKIVAEAYVGDFSNSAYSAANKEIKFNGVKYDIDASTVPSVYYVDGTAGVAYAGTASALVPAGYDSAKIRLLDVNNNNKVDKIVITPFNVEKVTFVATDNVTVTGTTGNKKLADIATYTGIAKNDRVVAIDAKYSTTAKIALEKATVENAKISATKGTDFKLGTTWYSNSSGTSIALDDTIDYVAFGGVIYYASVTGKGATSKDIAVVVNAGATTGADAGKPEATLIFADGTKKTVIVSKMNGTTATIAAGAANKNGTLAATDYDVEERVGELVTYIVDKDGKYELTDIAAPSTTTGNLAGYDGTGTNAAYTFANESVGGYSLADNATVIVLQRAATTTIIGNDAKVYTGKEIKNEYSAANFGNIANVGATALYGDVNGFDRAQIVVINNTALPTFSSGSNYGYLVSDAEKSYEGSKTYLVYDIWNGKEVLEDVKEEDTGAKQATMIEGTVVSFDSAGTKLVKNVTVANVTTAAIKGWEEGKTTGDISFMNSAGSASSKIDSDTVVLYVNSDTKEGILNHEIQKASDRNGDGSVTVADANARYLVSGSSVKVLVVDTRNNMEPLASVSVVAANADTTGKLAALFATYDEVVVTNAYAPGASVTVPAGKTLVLNTAFNETNGIVVNGNLEIYADAAYDLSKITSTTVGATVKFGTGVTTGAADYTGFFTVKGDPSTALAAAPTNMTFTWTADGADTTPATAGWLR